MKKISILALCVIVSAFSIHQVRSAELQTGNAISIENRTVSENFYTAGGSVSLNATFEKDVFVAGGKIDTTGNINGDLFVMGGEMAVRGKILGDVRIIGGQTTLFGEVAGDLVIIGGVITLDPSAKVLGQTIVVGGEFIQNAPLSQQAKILAGSVYLNTTVAGDTSVTTQKMTFGDHAMISGSLRYYAPDKAVREDGATTTGTITFNEIKSISEIGIVKTTILNLISFWIILKFITTLIVAFVLVYVFKVFTQGVNNTALDSFVKNMLVGVLMLIVVPIVVAVLFVSLIAMPIGFLILLVYIFTLIITPAVAGIVIGSLVGRMLEKDDETPHYVSFKSAAIGVVLFTAIQFVPFVGELTRIVFTLVALGAIYRYSHQSIIK